MAKNIKNGMAARATEDYLLRPACSKALMQLGDVRVRSQCICRNSIQEGRLAKDGRDTPDVHVLAAGLTTLHGVLWFRVLGS